MPRSRQPAMISFILACLLSAIAYRIRGGGLIQTGHTGLMRWLWAASVGLIAYAFGRHDALASAAVFAGSYAGMAWIEHGTWQRLRGWTDAAGLTLSGLARGLLVAIPLIFVGVHATLLTLMYTIAHPLAYYLGLRTLWTIPGAEAKTQGWAEYYAGAAWAAAILFAGV